MWTAAVLQILNRKAEQLKTSEHAGEVTYFHISCSQSNSCTFFFFNGMCLFPTDNFSSLIFYESRCQCEMKYFFKCVFLLGCLESSY